MNPFEQYENLGRQRVALNERIEDALREWVKDHSEEIYPEEPQAVCFNEWWKIDDEVFVGVTLDQEGNDYHSFRLNQDEILKYFE